MNCCDYDCTQGRDCPARSSGFGKIGRKEHGREPLRGSAWRRQLKYLAAAMLCTLAVMLVTGLTVALIPKKPASTCAALLKKPEVPAHIQIKCKEVA